MGNYSLIQTKCTRRGGTQPGLCNQSPLCSPLLKKIQQTLIYQTFAFLSLCELPSHPGKSQTTGFHFSLASMEYKPPPPDVS